MNTETVISLHLCLSLVIISHIISRGVKYGDFIGTFSINLFSTSKKSHLMLTTFLWGKKSGRKTAYTFLGTSTSM